MAKLIQRNTCPMGASAGDCFASSANAGAAAIRNNMPKRAKDGTKFRTLRVILPNLCLNRRARTRVCRVWRGRSAQPERAFRFPPAPGPQRAPPQFSSWPRSRLPSPARAWPSAAWRDCRWLPAAPVPARHKFPREPCAARHGRYPAPASRRLRPRRLPRVRPSMRALRSAMAF